MAAGSACSDAATITSSSPEVSGSALKRQRTASATSSTDGAPEKASHKRLRNMWQERQFTDAIVRCGERTWPVHRAVLASASAVFRRMFESNFQEGQAREIVVRDAEPDVVEELLEYVYTGTASTLALGLNSVDTEEASVEDVSFAVSSCHPGYSAKSLLQGEPSYWQSNGNLGSHWFTVILTRGRFHGARLRLEDHLNYSPLRIRVSLLHRGSPGAGDGCVGADAEVELRETTLPKEGYVELVDFVELRNVGHTVVGMKVAILETHSKGRDTRIGGLTILRREPKTTDPCSVRLLSLLEQAKLYQVPDLVLMCARRLLYEGLVDETCVASVVRALRDYKEDGGCHDMDELHRCVSRSRTLFDAICASL